MCEVSIGGGAGDGNVAGCSRGASRKHPCEGNLALRRKTLAV